MQETHLEKRPENRQFFAIAVTIVFFAFSAAWRIAAARNDLWFDEIISVRLAGLMSGWLGVFTEFRYDNNHYLNTLWVYALGLNQSPWWYRAPAVAAGLATIAAAYWTLRPYGPIAQKTGAVLFAFSYPLIHYSSEARGYSFQVLFCLLAFGCLDRFHRGARFRYAWGYGSMASLALLSQLLTVNFLMACGFWSISFQMKQEIPPRRKLQRLMACHLLPFLCSVALYFISIRFLEIGGGPKLNTLLVLTSAWSLLLYYATATWLRVSIGILALVLTFAGLWSYRKHEVERGDSSENWKFLFAFLVVIPLARVTIPGGLLFVRYFLVQLVFCLWLFSVLLADLAVRREKKTLVAVFLVLFLGLNLGQSRRLLHYGRGNYRAALQMMVDETDGRLLTIATSNKVHDVPVLEYFLAECNLDSKQIRTFDVSGHPEWFILHRTMTCAADLSEPPREFTVDDVSYALRQRFRTSYLSGFEWNCYHRKGSPASADPQ